MKPQPDLNLRQLQQLFKKAVQTANVDLNPLGLTESPSFSSLQRLEIYRNAYQIRLKESLIEDFPLVLEKAGTDRFNSIYEKYIQMHPSTFSSLAEYSQNFPSFIEFEEDLADLAWLDWYKVKISLMAEPSSIPLMSVEDFQKDPLRASLRIHPLHCVHQGARSYVLWSAAHEIKVRAVTQTEKLL